MSRFRGSPIRPSMPRADRALLRTVQEYLARSSGRSPAGVSEAGDPFGGTKPIAFDTPRVIFERLSSTTPTRYLAPERAGTLYFARGGAFGLGGNVHPIAPYAAIDDSQVAGFMSDGREWYEIARSQSGAPTLIPAAWWGAHPDTGANMTAKVQDALNNGANYFAPGTYLLSAPIVHSGTQIVWAYDCTFDFGDTVLAGPAFQFGDTGAPQSARSGMYGGKIRRNFTYSLNPADEGAGTGTAGTGLRCLGLDKPHFMDIEVQGFGQGLLIEGSLGRGCNNGTYERLKIKDCRYPITLSVSGVVGGVNENSFYDCQVQMESAFGSDLYHGTYGVEAVRVLWDFGSSGAPDNNRFINCNFESPSNVLYFYRKVRLEGRETYFMFCRWEGLGAGQTAITIGNAAKANTYICRNVFYHGFGLNTIVDAGYIEFKAVVDPLAIPLVADDTNNENQFISGWASVWAGGTGTNSAPVLSLQGSDTSTVIDVHRMSIPTPPRTMGRGPQVWRVAPEDASGNYGYLTWWEPNDVATPKNSLVLSKTASSGKYDLMVEDSFRIGGKGRFYPSTDDLIAAPVTSGGSIIFAGGTTTVPPIKARNNSSGAPAVGLTNSGGTTYEEWWSQAASSGDPNGLPTGTYNSIHRFYNTSGTIRNYMAMKYGAAPYPIVFGAFGAADGQYAVAFKAPTLAANTTYTLPATDGTSGYALTTNGSGVLSWSPNAGASGYYEPLTNGDVASPELIFADGDVIMVAG